MKLRHSPRLKAKGIKKELLPHLYELGARSTEDVLSMWNAETKRKVREMQFGVPPGERASPEHASNPEPVVTVDRISAHTRSPEAQVSDDTVVLIVPDLTFTIRNLTIAIPVSAIGKNLKAQT